MEWIKIEEKEPEVFCHVLIFSKDEGQCVGYKSSLGCYNHHPVGDFATGSVLYNVTHWMPLPESPKDDKINRLSTQGG